MSRSWCAAPVIVRGARARSPRRDTVGAPEEAFDAAYAFRGRMRAPEVLERARELEPEDLVVLGGPVEGRPKVVRLGLSAGTSGRLIVGFAEMTRLRDRDHPLGMAPADGVHLVRRVKLLGSELADRLERRVA